MSCTGGFSSQKEVFVSDKDKTCGHESHQTLLNPLRNPNNCQGICSHLRRGLRNGADDLSQQPVEFQAVVGLLICRRQILQHGKEVQVPLAIASFAKPLAKAEGVAPHPLMPDVQQPLQHHRRKSCAQVCPESLNPKPSPDGRAGFGSEEMCKVGRSGMQLQQPFKPQ